MVRVTLHYECHVLNIFITTCFGGRVRPSEGNCWNSEKGMYVFFFVEDIPLCYGIERQ